MNGISPEAFSEFFRDVHGYAPFPWQQRLADRVCRGNWPLAIAVPTAAGKTACLDVAVFALACRAPDPPRRIFFVVDRRIVVDQAKFHADNLANRLYGAKSGLLKRVADSLRDLAGDERPLDVYSLRGGMYRETAWTRSPLQPTIIASTVDQIGSRLLFRGYGVSDSMKPIHAALVGNDSLILLDEAHCARPFDQTLRAVENYRSWNESPAPFRFVSISATPNRLTSEDEILRDNLEDHHHTVLGPRIAASKPTMLVVAQKAKGAKAIIELVKLLEEHARRLATTYACVGIIVNRVRTARELKRRLGDEAVLLTGRMRPIDRDRLLKERLQPLISNADGVPPKFVVGTQCLECGADFDFHALVTECASLDALRQRFGRLNRVARRDSTEAVVVVRGDQAEQSDDPVYGDSLSKTWKWLESKAQDGVFDFGVKAIRESLEDSEDVAQLNAPTCNAPVLFPAHLDCWVQTSPIPTPDPEPALFLHGPDRPGQPDVQVVFRDDLGDDETLWSDVVALCPPSSSEAVSVPIGTFKDWLVGNDADEQDTDVEGGEVRLADGLETSGRRALCWLGPESSFAIGDPRDVRPEAVYVVACKQSDATRLGDFPFALTDAADEAFHRSRDKAILRLPGLLLEDDDDWRAALSEVIREKISIEHADWKPKIIARLLDERKRIVLRYPEPLIGIVVTGRGRLHEFDPTYLDDSEPTESYRGSAVSLVEHSVGVAQFAQEFAQRCGLDASLYFQAGLWHDLGKLDPRFQAMLRQTSPRTTVGVALAKSEGAPVTKQERAEARDVHRYPVAARHELLSTALLASQTDDDLLLHLVATHHGSARPFALPVQENDAAQSPFRTPEHFGRSFELPTSAQQIAEWNAELPERFWRIVRRHGWWGAAFHEAILRLADHAQSATEQEPEWVANEALTTVASRFETSPPATFFPISLTGIDGSQPLGFLAAIGALRLSEELFPGSRIRWELDGVWHPVLELPCRISTTEFVAALHARLHRPVNAGAVANAERLHKEYRIKLKDAEKALKAIKDRKLKGAEREKAIVAEVRPMQAEEAHARRLWLESLELAVPMPFLSLGKSISVTSEEFSAFAGRIAEGLHAHRPARRDDADFAASFGCEACVDRNDRVIPTQFQLITGSGHQFFLETFAALTESISVEQLQRGLFGPWAYTDPRLSFRWDPGDDRRYAVSWADPSGTTVCTEHGANLLAAYALPLFPVAPATDGVATTGFVRHNATTLFIWPIWTASHSCDAVRSLFQIDSLYRDGIVDWRTRQFGVRLAYQVRKVEVGTPPLSKLNFSNAVMV